MGVILPWDTPEPMTIVLHNSVSKSVCAVLFRIFDRINYFDASG